MTHIFKVIIISIISSTLPCCSKLQYDLYFYLKEEMHCWWENFDCFQLAQILITSLLLDTHFHNQQKHWIRTFFICLQWRIFFNWIDGCHFFEFSALVIWELYFRFILFFMLCLHLFHRKLRKEWAFDSTKETIWSVFWSQTYSCAKIQLIFDIV